MKVICSAGLVAAAVVLATGVASAQDWPKKQPIRVIVPFTAGSSTDIAARVVFEQVGKQVGQSVVVENRGGAGTTIGSAAVAKAEADGYTLLVNSTSHAAVEATYSKLPYRPAEDFAGITTIANLPFVVVAPLKYRAMSDLVSAGKSRSLNFGSAGAGSAGHLFLERVKTSAGINAVHVAYRGTPEGMTEIIADRLDMYPAPVLNAVPLMNDRKLVALAVGSKKRSAALPDIPTIEEAGLVNASYEFWVGAFAPAQTPRPIVERLNAEAVSALKNPDIAAKIASLGGEPMMMTTSEFDKFLREQIVLNTQIAKAAGFKPN